ncbi:MAG: transporter substrate-binding domain-containing protein [Desulfobacterales bacterium]|nr:transporter substrate-binding domain-containing protein [Desulfobacterales bacterium]MCP4159932.1 transporter substrate-binding domain-containing protein [Deltaproteobacteria bacterium]
MTKKALFYFILSFFVFNNFALANKLTIGYVNFPPYEYQEDGIPKGILVEIAKNIFNKANIEIHLKFLPFKRAFKMTKSGQIDGLFNFYKTDVRIPFFDYTEPIIKNPLVFFVRKDSVLEYSKLEDLKGLKIGVMSGYTYGTRFDKNNLFRREPTNSHDANFKKLILKRIDAYPCDNLVGIHVARRNKLYAKVKILKKPLKVMDGYIGFTKKKHLTTIKKINKIIMKMHSNSEIKHYIYNYIKKSNQY